MIRLCVILHDYGFASLSLQRLTTVEMLRKLSIFRLMSSCRQTRTRCCSGVLCMDSQLGAPHLLALWSSKSILWL